MVQTGPLLVLLGFYFCLQLARIIADLVLSAGLLGEIAVGIIFGGPLAGILPESWEETWLTVGYLGLILIVLSGGLDFDAQVFVRYVASCFLYIHLLPIQSHPYRLRRCFLGCPSPHRLLLRHPLESLRISYNPCLYRGLCPVINFPWNHFLRFAESD